MQAKHIARWAGMPSWLNKSNQWSLSESNSALQTHALVAFYRNVGARREDGREGRGKEK